MLGFLFLSLWRSRLPLMKDLPLINFEVIPAQKNRRPQTSKRTPKERFIGLAATAAAVAAASTAATSAAAAAVSAAAADGNERNQPAAHLTIPSFYWICSIVWLRRKICQNRNREFPKEWNSTGFLANGQGKERNSKIQTNNYKYCIKIQK
jgi:hypothetical protein